eukprot:357054-Chlamydomonas_euryale.AAC.2
MGAKTAQSVAARNRRASNERTCERWRIASGCAPACTACTASGCARACTACSLQACWDGKAACFVQSV